MWRTKMLPFAQSQKGWKGAQLLVNHAAGDTIIIGMWETEADARASGNMGGPHVQEQRSMAASLLGAPPEINMEYYEIAGDTWAK